MPGYTGDSCATQLVPLVEVPALPRPCPQGHIRIRGENFFQDTSLTCRYQALEVSETFRRVFGSFGIAKMSLYNHD